MVRTDVQLQHAAALRTASPVLPPAGPPQKAKQHREQVGQCRKRWPC